MKQNKFSFLVFIFIVLFYALIYLYFDGTYTIKSRLKTNLGKTSDHYADKVNVIEQERQLQLLLNKNHNDSVTEYKVAIAGDTMLARSIGTKINNGVDPFGEVAKYFESVDISILNLECVISDKGNPYPGKLFTFEAPVKSLEYLDSAGIDIVSVANNHSGDYQSEAFSDMLNRLRGKDIEYIGGGQNKQRAFTPVIKTVGNTKIAFFAFTNVETSYFKSSDTSVGLAWIDFIDIDNAIEQVRNDADIIVIYNHWGQEYKTTHNENQQMIAHHLIDVGADLVVGAHPHVRQEVEDYKDKKIFYSLGNFVFDLMNSYDASHAYVLEITLKNKQIVKTELLPVELSFEGYPSITNK